MTRDQSLSTCHLCWRFFFIHARRPQHTLKICSEKKTSDSTHSTQRIGYRRQIAYIIYVWMSFGQQLMRRQTFLSCRITYLTLICCRIRLHHNPVNPHNLKFYLFSVRTNSEHSTSTRVDARRRAPNENNNKNIEKQRIDNNSINLHSRQCVSAAIEIQPQNARSNIPTHVLLPRTTTAAFAMWGWALSIRRKIERR